MNYSDFLVTFSDGATVKQSAFTKTEAELRAAHERLLRGECYFVARTDRLPNKES